MTIQQLLKLATPAQIEEARELADQKMIELNIPEKLRDIAMAIALDSVCRVDQAVNQVFKQFN